MKKHGGMRGQGKAVTQNYQSHLVVLEPRMMFDAAAVASAADTLSSDVARDQASDAVNGDKWIEHAGGADQSPAVRDARALQNDSIRAFASPDGDNDPTQTADADDAGDLALAASDEAGKAFIFIDRSMPDYRMLADLWADRGTVVIIDPDADGIDQVRLALAGHDNIDSIHIVSHGQPGGFMLGSTWVDANTAQGALKASLESIGAKLTADGDILLYGCDIGADEAGRALLRTLADVTGADIAASDDDTGAASRGGDWVLEARAGHVQTLALDGGDWDALMAQVIINPTGGALADGSDGLRIYVTTTGQFQVVYQNQAQFYNPSTFTESTYLFNGMYMAVGDKVVGPDTGAESMTKVAWSSLGQTVSGTGTSADPFVVTTQLYYNVATTGYQAATDYLATVQVSYVAGTRYFTNTVTITPPSSNNAVVKWYHAADTYLGGSDAGPAYAIAPGKGATTSTSDNISVIATRRGYGTSSEVFVGFAEVDGSREFDRFYSGAYNGAGLYGSGMAKGGDIVNTINTNPSTDNGLGIQFTLGAINGPTTFSYRLVFDGDTSVDLDADNSTASGNNYVTSFGVGSNTPVAVVDSDIVIDNVIADISGATVTINNAQAGDVLGVIGTLPAGITASFSGNVLTLSGNATEAEYQEALKLVHFNSSNMATINRSLTIAVYNQIASEPATATTTINASRPPVVDLNSGTTSQQIINNGGLSSTSGWSTSGTSGALEDVNGNTAYRWSADYAAGSLTQSGITGWDTGYAPSGAAQLSFDFAWNNGAPDNSAAGTFKVSVGGVVYAEIVTGTTATSANTATITYLNGASGSPATIGAGSYGTPAFQNITINLPSTVPATGNLVFSYDAGLSRDDVVIDNVSVLRQVDAVSGLNYSTTYTENSAFVPIAAPAASIRDVDSANISSARIVLTNAQPGDTFNINTLPAGISSSIDTSVPGKITVTLTGTATKAAYANAIRAVTFGNTSEDPSTTPRTIQVTVNDGVLDSAPATTTVSVVAINDAPVNTIPTTAQSTPEDTGLVFSVAKGNAIRVSDVDDTILTAVFAMEHGTLHLSQTDGLTFNGNTENGWATISVTGTAAAINAALEGAVFIPSSDNTGEGRITIRTSDGELSDTDSFVIDFTPVADATDDSVTTNLDTPLTFDPLANDGYTGPALISGLGTPANGTVVRNADGTVTYTPNANFVGSDSFTYTVATVDPGFLYEFFDFKPSSTANANFDNVFPGGFPTTPPVLTGWTPAIAAWASYEIQTEADDFDAGMTVRWLGEFLVQTPGTYTFNLQADNAARLIVDGNIVQTNGYNNLGGTVTVTLTEGVHTFEVLWGDAASNEKIQLNYSGADTGGSMVDVSLSPHWGSKVRFETATVSVTVVDQPPVLVVPGAQTVAEDAPLPITGVSVNDVDSQSVTATLSVTGGTATVATGGGATITGSGTSAISITGSVSEVNAALAGLTFTGTADYHGPAQIQLRLMTAAPRTARRSRLPLRRLPISPTIRSRRTKTRRSASTC